LGFRIIDSHEVGHVEKWWSVKGSIKSGIIALQGEAGYQPDVLRAGIHWKSRFMYRLHKAHLVTISQGTIGYVFARDGHALKPTQTLGKEISESNNFQDVRAFLNNGGQKGPQRGILREGTYAFNLIQFVIITSDKTHYLSIDNNPSERGIIEAMAKTLASRNGFEPIIITGSDDKMGIVTIHDGASLKNGELIAPIVGEDPNDDTNCHNNFQNIESFLEASGLRGKQLQVLTDGTYFINRLFATVELIDKLKVPVGYVGVVVSYTGPKGSDTSGDDYKHGELVEIGHKGVWKEPLMPGKYAFNSYAGEVRLVPTTNIILKWNSNETGNHRYDENLKEVGLITKDAFEPVLPLSVVVHINYKKAPLVIQRFGDIKLLVDQTLDPMIAAYFKNIGQTKTLIELVQERNDIQDLATGAMKMKFDHYNIELEEVLIGTPSATNDDRNIDQILTQLRERQIASERILTYEGQQKAADKERELRESEAKAKQQSALTESHINIDIEANVGAAEYKKAIQQAEKTKTIAAAEATRITMLAEAEATKVAKIGIANAMATEAQVQAYGGPHYQVTKHVMDAITQAIEKSGVAIVPQQVVNFGGGENGQSTNALESLFNLLMSKHLGIDTNFSVKEESPQMKKIKEEILNKVEKEVIEEVSQEEIILTDIEEE